METKENDFKGRCNKGHLLVGEYEDTNGHLWKDDCPICIEEINKLRGEKQK